MCWLVVRSVTEGLMVPKTETRMVVSVSTKLMNRIKWVCARRALAQIVTDNELSNCIAGSSTYRARVRHHPNHVAPSPRPDQLAAQF